MPQSEFKVNISCEEGEIGSLIINYAAGSDLAAFVPEPLAIAGRISPAASADTGGANQ
jgi:hypothetical protein